MHAGNLVPFLERCAIVAGIAFLLILVATGFASTLPPGYGEMLFQENILNTSVLTITVLAAGAYCSFLLLFMWYRH